MIHTAKQLKDKVKNMSGGNSEVAQALIRTYFMERFLERVSVSEYRNNFILKGGMLVASIVGVDMRATMDIDTRNSYCFIKRSSSNKCYISFLWRRFIGSRWTWNGRRYCCFRRSCCWTSISSSWSCNGC